MSAINTGNNVLVDASGVTLGAFTPAAASNIKVQDGTIYTITSGAIGSNANGAVYLAKASGAIANLDSRHTFVALRYSIQGGASTDAPISNLAMSAKGSTVVFAGNADYPEITAPMIGDTQTKIVYRATGTLWNSIHPGTNIQGSQYLFEAGADGHLAKNPQAVVKNVSMRWYATSPANTQLGMPPTWGADNKPDVLSGLRFISIAGNPNIYLFSWNQPGVPSGFPNQAFDVRPDYVYDVALPGAQPTAVQRSNRRGTFTASASSFWGAVSINDFYLWIDPCTTLSASGVLDSGKTYLRTVSYAALGTAGTDNNVDVVAMRFQPTVVSPAGARLADASVVVLNTNANCTLTNAIGTYRARLVASGITDATGQIVITEPSTKNYTSNASHRTDSFVGQNRVRTQAWHKWWQAGTKMIPVSDSRNGLGTTAPELYAATDFKVNYRRAGSVFSSVALDTSGPQSPTVSMSADEGYNATQSTAGITVSYDAATGVTTLALPNGSVALDAMHKAVVDFHAHPDRNEIDSVVPISFASGIFACGNSLAVSGAPAATIVAGEKLKTLATTQAVAFNTAGNPTISVPFSDALGSRASITGLDPQGFGVTWHLRYKPASDSTWTTISGTGNVATLLVEQGSYDLQVRAPGYDWESDLTLDTAVSLSLQAGLREHVSANNTPQYTMVFDAALEAIFQYDPVATKVSVVNNSSGILQPGFAELYRAIQRIMHIPALVWSWTAPVAANATSQKILIPTGNPISMYLTDASTSTVKITCPIIHAASGQSADDRVRGNAAGYSIILGSPATAESAGLASQIISGLGGPSFDGAAHGLSVIEDLVQQVKTLSNAIKTRTDLVPDAPAAVGSAMTLDAAYDAAKTAAQQSSLSALGDDVVTLGSMVMDLPNLSDIEASTALAKAAQVAALGTPLQAADYTAPGNATEPPSPAAVAAAVRAELATELARVDAAVSSRSALTAQDIPAGITAAQVWSYTDRTLTAGGSVTPTPQPVQPAAQRNTTMHTHKRGDTWSLTAQADVRDLTTGTKANLTGWTIASQLRCAATGELIAEFVCTLTDPAAQTFTQVCENTATWPVGLALIDVQFTSEAGQTVSTDTQTIRIVPDVTQALTTEAAT